MFFYDDFVFLNESNHLETCLINLLIIIYHQYLP